MKGTMTRFGNPTSWGVPGGAAILGSHDAKKIPYFLVKTNFSLTMRGTYALFVSGNYRKINPNLDFILFLSRCRFQEKAV